MKPLPSPVRADSLSRQVFGILKEAVFEGKFQPGEQLAEIKVARWLNVSQATVREALVSMEQNGLVIRQKNRKTQVNKLTRNDVLDRVHMRVALEPIAAIKAAERMNSDEVAELTRLVHAMPAGETGKLKCTLADLDFHRFIWDRTGSPVLARTLEQLTTPLFAFVDNHENKAMAPTHLALVEAMQTRNQANIERTVRAHIEMDYRAFLQTSMNMAMA